MKTTIKNILCKIVSFCRYKTISKHRYGHGIHSPFIYEFIRNIIRDKTLYKEYYLINQIRNKLKKESEVITYIDIGEAYGKLNRKRKIGEIYKTTSVSHKYGELIYRIAKYYKPVNILEIGTSLGISTLYMALGNPKADIVTIEGVEQIIRLACNNFTIAGTNNIRPLKGLFDEKLPELFACGFKPNLAFIDGNHTYDATIRYFTMLYDSMEEGIIILDDIYWSCDMKKAWKYISTNSLVSIDMFQFGIVIKKDNLTPGNYTISF